MHSAALFYLRIFLVNTRAFLIDTVLTHFAVPEDSDHSVHTYDVVTVLASLEATFRTFLGSGTQVC